MHDAPGRLLTLARLGLGEPMSALSLPDEMAWDELWTMAEEQTLTGIVAEGIQRLPQVQWPDRRTRLQWFACVSEITAENAIVNSAMADVSALLTRAQISHCFFKGQTIAALYPHPASRQSGDVDFYVSPQHYDRAKTEISSKLGVTLEVEERTE